MTTNHYDSSDRLLTSVQYANNNYTYYLYDRNTDLVTIVRKTVNGQTVAVDYQYDNDRLKKITHNGFSYTYDYDVYGNQTGVSIGSTKLEQNTYKNRNGLVDKVTYDNYGNAMVHEDKIEKKFYRYQYDMIGRMFGMNTSDGQTLRIVYDDKPGWILSYRS